MFVKVAQTNTLRIRNEIKDQTLFIPFTEASYRFEGWIA